VAVGASNAAAQAEATATPMPSNNALVAMTRRAVLDESRIRTSNSYNIERLVSWLGANGFRRLNGEQLVRWMNGRIHREDAYGSVVVLPRGVSPAALLAGERGHPLWLRYIQSGGRIVHLGGMPFAVIESPKLEPQK
jgi:hypothetical protein